LVEKSKELKLSIDEAEKEAVELEKKRNAKLNLIGNIVADPVPKFKDEENNEVYRKWGEKPALEVDGKTLGHLHHHEVMALLDMVEFERGQKVAGHRGYFLKGAGVLLNQALINLGLATLVKDGYTAIQPPFFIKSSIMHETC
jgi:seryl-tRNA synthetase